MLMAFSYFKSPSESTGHGFRGWDSPDRNTTFCWGAGRDYDTSAVVFPNENI